MKRHIVSIIFLCVICLVGCKIEEPHGNNKDGFQENKVEVSLNSGEVEYPKSKEEEYPVNGVKFYFDEGCTAYRNGEYEAAVKALKMSVLMDGKKEYITQSYTVLGHCMTELGDMENAEVYYKKALETGNDTAMCYNNLGLYYRKCNDYKKAEENYLQAIEADKTYSEALSSLGVLYALIGRTEESVALLEQAIEYSTKPRPEYDANLAYSYAAMGQIEKARESLAIAREKGYAEEKCEIVSACIDEFEEEFKKELIPTPNLTEIPQQKKGIVIAIDPGHQAKGNYEKEPVGPGATEQKTKVSSGTQGVSTKVPEHEFTLELSLKLRDTLVAEGYEVVMTRETAEVDISNVERAEIANEAKADIYIRIHADGADSEAANGISVLYPSENNPYVAELSPDSKRLAQEVLDEMCEATGAKKRGIIKRDDLSGTNWAQMPVILIEAGFMTNKAEDERLQDPEYQAKLVQGIVNGIEEYLNE